MNNSPVQSKTDPAKAEAEKPEPAGETPQDPHAGRRYSVGTTASKGKRNIRCVETNDPKKGCRFL